ncbi:unnamed protein product [Diatraea saccharalis]|uniref:Uncharacterized protein n=1 Tax=Diatraea saccharalis TaxID=40085 RepID=A0A9N9WDE6_9NEOP|nr:unnamed protein product [Diatraea saccharalis]
MIHTHTSHLLYPTQHIHTQSHFHSYTYIYIHTLSHTHVSVCVCERRGRGGGRLTRSATKVGVARDPISTSSAGPSTSRDNESLYDSCSGREESLDRTNTRSPELVTQQDDTEDGALRERSPHRTPTPTTRSKARAEAVNPPPEQLAQIPVVEITRLDDDSVKDAEDSDPPESISTTASRRSSGSGNLRYFMGCGKRAHSDSNSAGSDNSAGTLTGRRIAKRKTKRATKRTAEESEEFATPTTPAPRSKAAYLKKAPAKTLDSGHMWGLAKSRNDTQIGSDDDYDPVMDEGGEPADGRALPPRAPVTILDINERALEQINRIANACAKSRNLKGTMVKEVNQGIKTLKYLLNQTLTVSADEEIRILRAENTRVRSELAHLSNELKALKKDMAARAMNPEGTTKRSQKKSLTTPPIIVQGNEMDEDLGLPSGTLGRLQNAALETASKYFEARLAGLESRLPPEKSYRPPLAADKRRESAQQNVDTQPGKPSPSGSFEGGHQKPKSGKGRGAALPKKGAAPNPKKDVPSSSKEAGQKKKATPPQQQGTLKKEEPLSKNVVRKEEFPPLQRAKKQRVDEPEKPGPSNCDGDIDESESDELEDSEESDTENEDELPSPNAMLSADLTNQLRQNREALLAEVNFMVDGMEAVINDRYYGRGKLADEICEFGGQGLVGVRHYYLKADKLWDKVEEYFFKSGKALDEMSSNIRRLMRRNKNLKCEIMMLRTGVLKSRVDEILGKKLRDAGCGTEAREVRDVTCGAKARPGVRERRIQTETSVSPSTKEAMTMVVLCMRERGCQTETSVSPGMSDWLNEPVMRDRCTQAEVFVPLKNFSDAGIQHVQHVGHCDVGVQSTIERKRRKVEEKNREDKERRVGGKEAPMPPRQAPAPMERAPVPEAREPPYTHKKKGRAKLKEMGTTAILVSIPPEEEKKGSITGKPSGRYSFRIWGSQELKWEEPPPGPCF